MADVKPEMKVVEDQQNYNSNSNGSVSVATNAGQVPDHVRPNNHKEYPFHFDVDGVLPKSPAKDRREGVVGEGFTRRAVRFTTSRREVYESPGVRRALRNSFKYSFSLRVKDFIKEKT
ncbi:hypothetical protein J437_LFUL000463 [Ladona fulva]|uniref:Uncharacterized protein n=1 Tax=Ladona fulva TaxID=123851 RepID=A0A8K0KIX9_LADFU|nr:hypothetical protein J437_LFUL000463 [Ladona fulva]